MPNFGGDSAGLWWGFLFSCFYKPKRRYCRAISLKVLAALLGGKIKICNKLWKRIFIMPCLCQ